MLKQRTDSEIMQQLVAFCRDGFSSGHPSPFAAEIVETSTHKNLVSYRNQVVPDSDPTAHAEVGVVRLACQQLATTSLKGYTLFSTIQPCPMCMTAILWSGLDRVVYGTTFEDPAKGEEALFYGYDPHTIEASCGFECEVNGPVEEKLTRSLLEDPTVAKYLETCRAKDLRI